jgi:hypothetical protein
MATHRSVVSTVFGAPFLLLCAAAIGGEGINLTVTNDGIVDIFVSVYDTSVGPSAVVLSHQRINGFTSVPISVSADAGGRGNVSWTAIGVDNRDPQCGRGASNGLSGDATVNVHVGSGCGT